jgi:hypothetical protein
MPLIRRSGSTAFQPRSEDYVPPSARARWKQAWRETETESEMDLLRPVVALGTFVYGWIRDRRVPRRR